MHASGGRAVGVLLLAVLGVFTAQQALAPVLAPLAREVGLAEVQLGLVMAVAAVLFAVTSVLWGRAVDAWGTRRVLLLGMSIALAGVAGFAVVSQLALAGATPPPSTLALMLLTRSALFGTGIGAVPVAAMAYVAATTTGEQARTRGIGRLGAVQGVAIALGPALGGLLAFAGLLGPIWVAPAVVLLALVAVATLLPRAPAPVRRADEARPAALKPWDPRFWPFLAVGFLLFLTLAMVLIILGFPFQDRLGLDAEATAQATGAAAFATGVVLIAAQGFLVPRLGWPAVRLIRTGIPIALVAFVALTVAPNFPTMTASTMLLGLGLGLAIPGYTAGPTLRVGPDGQGGVAGLVNATNGATFVIGPLAGTALYQIRPELPMIVSAVLCAVATVFAVAHPGLRSGGSALREAPTPDPDALFAECGRCPPR